MGKDITTADQATAAFRTAGIDCTLTVAPTVPVDDDLGLAPDNYQCTTNGLTVTFSIFADAAKMATARDLISGPMAAFIKSTGISTLERITANEGRWSASVDTTPPSTDPAPTTQMHSLGKKLAAALGGTLNIIKL